MAKRASAQSPRRLRGLQRRINGQVVAVPHDLEAELLKSECELDEFLARSRTRGKVAPLTTEQVQRALDIIARLANLAEQ
jgi:hypothetical protein